MNDRPSPSDVRTRVLAALVFGALTAAYVTARGLHEPLWPTDFDQLWHAARSLLQGGDPYETVGPGRPFPWLWPLYYPFPAVIIAVPFATLPVLWARVAFSTLSGAVLGWALGPRVRTHWPILLSAAYIISTSRAQWAPLLLAAAWVPALSFVVAAKPNVGLAALAGQRWNGIVAAAISCVLIFVASFIVAPGWVSSWREAISSAPHIQAAVTVLPAGPFLALTALRWKRPEARLFLALVAIPHTPSVYDLLLLFFACRTARETIILGLLTQAAYWGIVMFGSFSTFDAYAEGLGRTIIYVVYIPVLLSILARPNQSGENEENVAAAGPQKIVPRNWLDGTLLSLLLVAGVFLIWLPLVTYR
jgi:hypothetical protein